MRRLGTWYQDKRGSFRLSYDSVPTAKPQFQTTWADSGLLKDSLGHEI